MTDYEIYVFILCLIVFLCLTALSVYCIAVITKLSLRLINSGAEDQEIIREYRTKKNKKPNTFAKIADYAISGAVCLVFVVMLIGSLAIKCTENSCCGVIPTYRVVKSGSMAKINDTNDFLEENGINNQIQRFDIIRTEKLPDEFELKLYDIVVYETQGELVVHRIVEIEEPNEKHPNSRHFRLQGDAVPYPDSFPVFYNQMKAIYRGNRIPFVGTFILFMQSPAGWLCTFLIVAAMIVTPILDKKLMAAKNARLKLYFESESKEHKETALTGGATND